MAASKSSRGIGNVIAPWRFIAFVATGLIAGAILLPMMGVEFGVMASFDIAAAVFLLACLPLFTYEAEAMRVAARRNDANRVALLALSAVVSVVIVIVVAGALLQPESPKPIDVALIIATLLLCWIFSNMVYALHYAHMFYTRGKNGKDQGGLQFPDTAEPDYSDFVYFAFCLGMTFQTSDTNIASRHFRRVATFHGMAAFFFNIGVIAFTINILGH